MTFQRKLLLGFLLMVLPVLLIGAEAIRSNALEREALEALGTSLSRTRTYAEVETAMFNQSEVVWRYLSGLDPTARTEVGLSREVVDYWMDRWTAELRPDERELADAVRIIQNQMVQVSDSVFHLADAGQREAAYVLARRELKGRLLPALTAMNHEIYRRAREYSVRTAFGNVEEIVVTERRILFGILLVAAAAGLVTSILISRSLARPISRLREEMALVGAGQLDYPIDVKSPDEIGDLARSFAQMTDNLRQSRSHMERLNAELEQKVAQLERTQAQLVQSEKLASIGEMAAAVAHGLRNPLASLRASAQLVQRHPESPAAQEHLTSIIDEVDRLDRRVSHLLSFSRPAPFHPLRESVRQLVDGLLQPFAQLMEDQRVTLKVDVPHGLPDIRVDPMQVEQAIVEVISNSLDAMPAGGELTIRARPAAEAGASGVAIEIADTGRGIPEGVLASVCEPFFTTRQEGTGLGLAIAKRYVEQNGGRLEISSQAGVGTSVQIWLPAAEPEAALSGSREG